MHRYHITLNSRTIIHLKHPVIYCIMTLNEGDGNDWWGW